MTRNSTAGYIVRRHPTTNRYYVVVAGERVDPYRRTRGGDAVYGRNWGWPTADAAHAAGVDIVAGLDARRTFELETEREREFSRALEVESWQERALEREW